MQIARFNCPNVLDVKAEEKVGTSTELRLDSYLASKLVDDRSADEKTQPNTVCVHLLGVFDLAKHLEKLLLVVVFDPHACVFDLKDNLRILARKHDLSVDLI